MIKQSYVILDPPYKIISFKVRSLPYPRHTDKGRIKKYPILATYKNEVKVNEYATELNLRKDVSSALPYEDIQSVELEDAMLNTVITIRTGSDTIRLTTQQKELSDLRSSGVYATIYAGHFKNWHKENLNGTLKALTELGKRG